jgi:hypothetical protein
MDIPWWWPIYLAKGGDEMTKRQWRRCRGQMRGAKTLRQRERLWNRYERTMKLWWDQPW